VNKLLVMVILNLGEVRGGGARSLLKRWQLSLIDCAAVIFPRAYSLVFYYVLIMLILYAKWEMCMD